MPDPDRLRALRVDRYRRSALVPGQVNRVLAEGRAGESAFDLIEEYSWADGEAAGAALADPSWVPAGAAGFEAGPDALADVVVGRVRPRFGELFPDDDLLRLFTFLRFREGVDPDVARRHWADVHGPIADRVIGECFGALSYTQVPADPALGEMLAAVRPAGRQLDGFVVTHWAGSPEDILRNFSTEKADRGNEALLADEPRFMAPAEDQGSTAMMKTVAEWQNG